MAEARVPATPTPMARLAEIGAIIVVLGGFADVTLHAIEIIDHNSPAAHDLIVGAPHDDLGDRHASWPLRPTMEQTETSTPAVAGSLDDALRRTQPQQ